MSRLLEIVASQVAGGHLDKLSSQLGISEDAAQKGLGVALPALIGGLARNANQSPAGAQALAGALERDHDGSLLDQVGPLLSMLGGSGGGGKKGGLGGLLGMAGSLLGSRKPKAPAKAADGTGILRHILGDRQASVERAVGQASGIDAAKAGQMLAMIAPIVMAALGRLKKSGGLDAGALAGLLQSEKQDLESRQPQVSGLLAMLDRDGDGDTSDDLAQLGSSLLGAYMKRGS